MVKKSYERYKLVPYPVIVAAVAGDEEALQEVFRHYSGYIAKLSMRPFYDESGDCRFLVDEDIRHELENHLAQAIVGKFRVT